MKHNVKILLLMTMLAFVGIRCSTDEALPEKQHKPEAILKAVGAAGIAGVNWADGRDNFVDGWVIPSGLTASDNYTTVSAKANSILAGFQTNMPGVNTVRLPINPPSVLESWWNSYNGAIDRAVSRNMNVILACWEAASSRNGLIDNTTTFWQMWDVVIAKYGSNSRVFFEVFNEPHGYSLSALGNIYAEFLSRYPNVPRGRIILGGTGYSENVTGIGADGRFSGCLLALHNYAFWNTSRTTVSAWEQDWRNRMGSYASRTVVTEYGAAMTTGKNYTGPVNNDHEIAYIQASTNVFRNDGVASVYWPGLRDGDSYSIQNRGGSGTNITLTTTNSSGVQRIRYGWGENVSGGGGGTTYYRLQNRGTGLYLDGMGRTTNGDACGQYANTTHVNAQWEMISTGNYYYFQNRGTGLRLDGMGRTSNGADAGQWANTTSNNAQWSVQQYSGNYYRIQNRATGLYLDGMGRTSNGSSCGQYANTTHVNAQWQLIAF